VRRQCSVGGCAGGGQDHAGESHGQIAGCGFHRIQCTPDLLPSDVTGIHFFNQKTCDFEFRPGPVNANILLVDEINRATPRTQSALLEAMEERQVTAEGETKLLPRPFTVLATQNPIELEGTFPLPEAQLDRFLLRVHMGYPTETEDETILLRFAEHNPIEDLSSVVPADDLLLLQQACRRVLVAPALRHYMVQLVHATRGHPQVELGASPRAMLGLFRTAQSLAAVRGRAYVIPDDIKYLAPFVMEHRVIAHAQSGLRGRSTADILREVVASVSVPVEEEAGAPPRSAG
jgi:MoxR-like ATPase